MTLCNDGNSQAARTRLVALMRDQGATATMFGASGLEDELEMIRDQFRRYSVEKIIPHAHEWHLKDELIPMEVIDELAEAAGQAPDHVAADLDRAATWIVDRCAPPGQ